MRFRALSSYSIALALIALLCAALSYKCLGAEASPSSSRPAPVAPAPLEGATKLLSGWKLNQESYSSGRFDVFICKQAIRIVNQKTRVVIVSQAPAWRLYVIDDSIKAFCTPKLEEIGNGLGRTLAMFGAPVFTDMPVVMIKKSRDGAMNLESYASPPGFEQIQRRKIRTQQITANAAVDINYKIWVSDFPKEECLLLSHLYGLPPLQGVPMSFLNTNQNSHTHRELTTESAVQANFPPTIFTVPKGYHQAKSIEDLRATSAQNEGIDMVLNRLVDPDVKATGKQKSQLGPKNADVKQ